MERPPLSLPESSPSGACLDAPYTPDPLDRDFSWEQLWELERQFKLEPYPDLEARRVLATRLNLKEEQVETWFIQRSLEQEMRPRIARLQQSVRPNTSSCESHKAHCCRPPSWRFRLIPINSSESSSSCEHSCGFCHPEFVDPRAAPTCGPNPLVDSWLHRTHQNAGGFPETG